MNVYGFLILTAISSFPLYGQISEADSTDVIHAVYTAKQHYQLAIAGNSNAYSGSEYVSPLKDKKVIGDPYYIDFDWQLGSVLYSGHWYDSVPLRYDMANDQLLIEYAQGYESILLNTERISQFKIYNHTFVRLTFNPDNNIKEGFYDLLYSGSSNVYAKRSKYIKDIMDQNIMKVEFVEKTKYFLNKNNQYFIVDKKRDLWTIFPSQKTAIRKRLSSEKISFKSNPKRALVLVAQWTEKWEN